RKALPEPEPTGRSAMTYISEEMLKTLTKNVAKELSGLSEKERDTFLAEAVRTSRREYDALKLYSTQTGKECYPLTHSQKMIYHSEKRYSGTSCENLIYMIKYPAILNKKRLQEAINRLLLRNDSFRLRMVEVEHESAMVPGQYISPHREYTVDNLDFSTSGRHELEQWIDRNNKKTFDFLNNQLYYFAYIKFNEQESGYYMKIHHIVSDGWTTFLAASQIDEMYRTPGNGQEIGTQTAYSYLDYISHDRDYFGSFQVKEDIAFWHENLRPLPGEVSLATQKGDPANIEGEVATLPFPAVLREKIHDYCRRNKTSIFKLLLSALSIYVSKVNRSDDFIIGTLNHNRALKEYQKTAGTFIRFIPLRIKAPGNLPFLDFVEENGKNVNHILKNHREYPFDVLINELREKSKLDPSYFYNINLIGHPDVEELNYKIQHYFPDYEPTQLTVHINFSNRDTEGILELEWDYRRELFSRPDIEGIHHGLTRILEDALDNPGKKLEEIEYLTGEEKKRLEETGQWPEWLPKGHTYTPGENRELIYMDGIGIDPIKIENCLLKHESITGAVVVGKYDNGTRYLCAFITAETILKEPLNEYLAPQLPPYMIPQQYVRIDKIPTTSEGKAQRELLETIDIAINQDYSAPTGEVEKKLAEIWARVIGIKKESIGTDANFFRMGGHSLSATLLLSRIHKEFDVKLQLVTIFGSPELRTLAECIKDTISKTKYAAIEPAEKKDYYQLSSAQKRLYVLQQVEPSGTGYNLPQLFQLQEKPDKEKLIRIFKKLIQRHESFRTTFRLKNGEPLQRISRHVPFDIKEFRAGPVETEEKIINRFVRPFDLSTAPLLRVELLETTEGNHVVMIDMHHIISDGVSHTILAREFTALYSGEKLQPCKLQYKDFAQWRNSRLQQEKIKKQQQYWLKEFEGTIPVLYLPTDYPRPAIRTFEGDRTHFEIDEQQTAALNRLAEDEGTTIYAVLLTLSNLFFSKISHQQDIVIGTPVAGRNHIDLETIIGMFVNTLPLRNYPRKQQPIKEFLAEVKKRNLDAFDNQDYQFEEMVEQLAVQRDAGRNPLFDVMFSLQNIVDKSKRVSPPEQPAYRYENKTAKFDITIDVRETERTLFCSFQFNTRLFNKETVERFGIYYRNIARAVVENPAQTTAGVELITPGEKSRLLSGFNGPRTPYHREKTIPRLFCEQAERTPLQIAAVFGNKSLTYDRLNRRSSAMAAVLAEKGIKPEEIVAVMLDSSLETVVVLMAVLKAGGVYLPIDPTTPPRRIAFMCNDARARLMITRGKNLDIAGITTRSELETVFDIDDFKEIESASNENGGALQNQAPGNLAYIIYTSGTTGRPKGVMTEHRSAVNVLLWFGRNYRLAPGINVMQVTNITFDPSVEQIFGTLAHGATLHVVHRELLAHRNSFLRYVREKQIHMVNFIPAALKELLLEGEKPATLGIVISGGEKLEDSLKEQLLSKGYRLYNHYGPTETTVDTLTSTCVAGEPNTLGHPVDNTACYVVDECLALVPIAISGELCIAGAGIARGYLNRPELTGEKFVPNPFATTEGEIMYRSGDRVKRRTDGAIQFLGRIGRQVKIRGYRIELREIEKQLITHPEIEDALVVTYGKNTAQLCAYIVSTHEKNQQGWRDYLAEILPRYMIPTIFLTIDGFPLTTGGKIDTNALPQPDLTTEHMGDRTGIYTRPTGHTQKKLTGIWAGALELAKEKISIYSNFFQLGGNSLNAIAILA
ncbi:MAG: amino acid adenylation domain-containing protein, partial [bacterium]|nr:amino acid adenylation domain-containing protein [bacterium]